MLLLGLSARLLVVFVGDCAGSGQGGGLTLADAPGKKISVAANTRQEKVRRSPMLVMFGLECGLGLYDSLPQGAGQP